MVLLASFFERLFKFSPLQFSEGELGLQAGDNILLFALLFAVLALGAGAIYYAARIYPSARSRAFSLGLRLAALLLLCLPLLEPVLIVPDVAPRENFVAVLVDGSQSMQIPDGVYDTHREGDVRHLLYEQGGGLIGSLQQDFRLRYYRFSEQAARIDSIQTDPSDGEQTNLSAALERVVSDFKGIPLAGIVLLTDGGDNSSDSPQSVAEQLGSLDIPLHIVGLGREQLESDREILEATVSKRVEEETGAEIDLTVRSWRTEPQPVTFSLYHDDEIVLTENRQLSGEGTIDQFSFFYEPEDRGAAEYVVEVSEAAGEINTRNNSTRLLIDPQNDTTRVLFVEGHPRYEFKYAKRTLENDPAIKFVSITRTGPGRFYRQGIESPDQLTGGFADSTEELNTYKAVIFGDIEASAFTPAQLQMVEQFVRTRGGGVLMLGGDDSFAGGNYQNTPIADLLPVTLPSSRSAEPFSLSGDNSLPDSLQGYMFAPTAAGLENSILKLSSDQSLNRGRWREMPRLKSLTPLGEIKPGAAALAEAVPPGVDEGAPVLVVQRYGKGRSAALATASTWRWQMELPAEDSRFERFWRQLIRWLTASAPDRIDVSITADGLTPGESVPIQVRVYDEDYLPLDEADLQSTVLDPRGSEHTVEFQENLIEPGVYEASFAAEHTGVHRLTVSSDTSGGGLGAAELPFLVQTSNREFYDAALKKEFLQGLADLTGGSYYEPGAADQIPANLVTRQTSRSVYQVDYLWDMPFLFILAILLLSIEWVYRRRRGLP